MENNNNKKSKKVFLIIQIVAGALVVLAFLVSIMVELIAPESAFGAWLSRNVWNIRQTGASLNTHLPVIIHSLIYIVLILAVCKLVRTIFSRQMNKSNKTKTVITLFDGFVKYGCAIAIVLLILRACGVNTQALWASAGILTLVIGLGAQSLIADVIAGIFIIFENEYQVGEIVSIDEFRGTVIEIGIRATKLLDAAGNIKIINNSDVSNVVNMSRELSLAVVECEFPYDVPIEFVENILKNSFPEMQKKIPAIIDGPFYKGVSMYESSNVAVKVVATCREEDRYQVQRDLLREYRVVLVRNGIDLSYDQVVLNQAKSSNITVSKDEIRKANDFVSEQRTSSSNYEEQQKD